ncbi:MAG: glycosyltransferase family 9 protein [Nitrospinota bacterium]
MKKDRILKKIYLGIRKAALSIPAILYPSGNNGFPQKDLVKRILVVSFDRIGDTVLAIPVFKALKKGFHEAQITFLHRPITKDLVKQIPSINKTILCIKKQGLNISRIKRLREENFDLAVDLNSDYRIGSALLISLSGARFKIGYDIGGRGFGFNYKVKPKKEKRHQVDIFLDIIAPLNIDISDRTPELHVLDRDKERITELLRKEDVLNTDILVAVAPGGYYPSQCWNPKRFAETADIISERYNTKVVIVGDKNMAATYKEMLSAMKTDPVNMVNGLTLGELSALFERCKIVLCNNSGPLHIAAAVNTPTVSMMGPTVPWQWWPIGNNHIVLRNDIDCSPCNRGDCKGHDCMEGITVKEVLDAIRRQF